MSTEMIIRNKETFALNYPVKQNKTTSIILILKESVITKSSEKLSSLIYSNKGLNFNKIFLSEKGRLIKYLIEVATTMNDCFVSIRQTIGLRQPQSN